jgi:adenosylcobinamide-GDP ribazoletransferase
LNGFLTALQFLTIVPVPGRRDIPVGRSVVWFPVVGIVIGLVLAGFYWLLQLALPYSVAAALTLAALVAVTGGLHLDGLADTCDGLAGHKTVEDRHRIMRDSRVGGYGIIGIAMLLLIQFAALGSLPAGLALVSLILMTTAGRWAVVYAIFAHPYARSEGLGRDFKAGTGRGTLAVATLVTLAVAAVTLRWWIGPAVLLLAWGLTAMLGGIFNRTFAGLTGDNYGAIDEIVEAFVLILINLAVGLDLI